MRLIKLEMLNLASLDRDGGEVINFEEGALKDSNIFSIVGPTGSGKSTILDAICLALYNMAPRYPRKSGERKPYKIFGEDAGNEKNRLSPTDGRNILTHGKKEGYSKLTFLANNGNVYCAEWHVGFKEKHYNDVVTKLYKLNAQNGQAAKPEEAEWSDLPKIIGLDYEQFMRTVLIAQGSFASFLNAKEDERYQLLEKLVGGEETYTAIVAKIKEETDKSKAAYNAISASISAEEAYVIADEKELEQLKDTIRQLQEDEKRLKGDLQKVGDALKWFDDEQIYNENLCKYSEALERATRNMEEAKERFGRLELHDFAAEAVKYCNATKEAEREMDKVKKDLDALTADKEKQATAIAKEEDALKAIKDDEAKEKGNLDKQKPHIDKARQIKGELAATIASGKEKRTARDECEKARNEAEQAVADNTKNIEAAKQKLESATTTLEKLAKEVEAEKEKLSAEVRNASEAYESERGKIDGADAQTLQNAKAAADNKLNSLKDAIRIQGDLAAKNKEAQDNRKQRDELSRRNASIERELNGFTIEPLANELAKLRNVHTLMTSEDWQLHRHNLADGEPCPLCGAKEHPYRKDENLEPAVNDLAKLIDEKEAALKSQTEQREGLLKEKSGNDGMLASLDKSLPTLEVQIAKLEVEWGLICAAYPDWPSDETQLKATVLPAVNKEVGDADRALASYNALVKQAEALRKKKEAAEAAKKTYEEKSSKQVEDAKNAQTKANIDLQVEQGKTADLVKQKEAKARDLEQADANLNAAREEVVKKRQAIKDEIGEKDPDDLERALTETWQNAAKAVGDKESAISQMRQHLEGIKGNIDSKSNNLKELEKKRDDSRRLLNAWLDDKASQRALSVDDIARIAAATDDWESIRHEKDSLSQSLTMAQTTLRNEQMRHAEHQAKRPQETKEELDVRKTELDDLSSRQSTALLNARTRMNQHDLATQKLGNLLDQKRDAEEHKTEWEEIDKAIGSDGKQLRKIAQCYTLRFLIEHANYEIRRFNSRYELLQVKNSLIIRVIDHDRADEERETTSLSGGETFIVSLGLALGLSSLSSRNISFENLFIDEGFGTLDPDTLATVIDSLAMLQSSQGKKVGVISHTDTMSERITTQIRVVKNGNTGSSHIEIYP